MRIAERIDSFTQAESSSEAQNGDENVALVQYNVSGAILNAGLF